MKIDTKNFSLMTLILPMAGGWGQSGLMPVDERKGGEKKRERERHDRLLQPFIIMQLLAES